MCNAGAGRLDGRGARNETGSRLTGLSGRGEDLPGVDSHGTCVDGFWVCRGPIRCVPSRARAHRAPPLRAGVRTVAVARQGADCPGVLVNLLSAQHHLRLVRALDRSGPLIARPPIQAVSIALFLAVVGLGMALALVSVG